LLKILSLAEEQGELDPKAPAYVRERQFESTSEQEDQIKTQTVSEDKAKDCMPIDSV
jgi:hypothetical protein